MDKNRYIKKVQALSLKEKRDLIVRAKAVCQKWWVDILDCSKSLRRQTVDMSFEEILSKLDKTCHFTVIHRNECGENHIEVAFSTMNGPDYFLWVNVGMEHASMFDKFMEDGE